MDTGLDWVAKSLSLLVLHFCRAMRDLESERQQRQEALQLKRDELKAWENQLSTTNHHRGQLEQAITRAKERTYQLR